ncbi:MAG: hypothetical protein ACR2LX_09235 [Jatrophihabitans sp.]
MAVTLARPRTLLTRPDHGTLDEVGTVGFGDTDGEDGRDAAVLGAGDAVDGVGPVDVPDGGAVVDAVLDTPLVDSDGLAEARLACVGEGVAERVG